MKTGGELRGLYIALITALIHGLIYVFLVPLWQHYDEPTHFEYVWLIAKRNGIPQKGDFDPQMRREIAMSMLEAQFYDDLEYKPTVDTQKPWIGYVQIGDPPLYYGLTSLPLRLFLNAPPGTQLIVCRLVSLLLFLITILSSWGITKEIFPGNRRLELLVPLSLSLIPGFVDLMTSVNNDVGAVAIFSIFLWGSFYLINRCFSILGVLWVVVAAFLCFLTKATIFPAVLLVVPVLLITLFKNRTGKWIFVGLAVISLILIRTIFHWGSPRWWYRLNDQDFSFRVSSATAPLGEYIFMVDPTAKRNPRWMRALSQPIPSEITDQLKGKSVTLGAWIWGSVPEEILFPELHTQSISFQKRIEIGTQPEFYSFSFTLPEDTRRMWLTIDPKRRTDYQTYISFDGLVLVEGDFTKAGEPEFSDLTGLNGMWDGKPFNNLIRNPSAESATISINLMLDSLSTRFLPGGSRLSGWMASIIDPAGAWYYFRLEIANLFRTFWGKFGWGHVPLLGSKPFRLLLIPTLLGLIGGCLQLVRQRSKLPWHNVILAVLAMMFLWGATLLRGANYIFSIRLFFPPARYAYPAMVPTMLFLVIGWLYWLRKAEWKKVLIIWFTSFGLLDIMAIFSIFRYYHV